MRKESVSGPGLRRLVHFSCGAASAVAAKLTVARHSNVVVVNAYVAEEHPDNRRFLQDVEGWLGVPVVQLRDTRFEASAYEVFRRVRLTKTRYGAPCTGRLKRQLLTAFRRPGDLSVVGFTVEEQARADRFIEREPAEFPLIEAGLAKSDCLGMIERAGLRLPEMYRLGYPNANCIGCVKGGAGYWNKIRRDFPQRFEQMAALEDEIGPTSYLFRDRKTGVRIPLRLLPANAGRTKEVLPECGFACLASEDEIHDLESASYRQGPSAVCLASDGCQPTP